jgi:hypothetical protein
MSGLLKRVALFCVLTVGLSALVALPYLTIH